MTYVYLDMVPESIQVSVRRPLYFMAWLQRTTGQTVNRLKLYNDGDIVLTEAQQARADRIGLYNDGDMGAINGGCSAICAHNTAANTRAITAILCSGQPGSR